MEKRRFSSKVARSFAAISPHRRQSHFFESAVTVRGVATFPPVAGTRSKAARIPPSRPPRGTFRPVYSFCAAPWVGFPSCSSFVRKWRRAPLIDSHPQPMAWPYRWAVIQWRRGPAAGRRRGQARSGQGGGAVEWRTAGLARPGGNEPGGPERAAPEWGECERAEWRLPGPLWPPHPAGERRRRWGGPLGPC